MGKVSAKSRMVLGLAAVLVIAGLVWLAGAGRAPQGAAAPVEHAVVPVAEARQLRLGLNIAAGSALHAAAELFAERVAERSGGRLKVTVHPDQQLGSDDQMLEMARNGGLDLVLTPTAKLSSAVPAMQYADLPFYFSSREELYAMLDGEPGALLLSKLGRIDLVGLTFWENGFKQFTANTPIRHPDDFGHLRIRTMKSPMIADQFASLGATPIPIDFHATYQALKDGAVDGQENPLVAIVGMRFHEVQKHLTLSNHAYLAYVFSVSRKIYETLSPEMREIISQTARELTLWERQETARREADFIDKIRAAGVEIHTLSAEERRSFAQVMAPIADKFGFEVGYDLLAKTEELRFTQAARSGDVKGRQPWVLALDADLSARGAQAGGAIYRGAQMAIEDINRKGGLLGAPLRLLARDHAANPMVGRRNLELFASYPSVLAVMGGMHSTVVTEELDDIHRLKIPYLIPWAAAQGITLHDHRPSYTFRVSINDTQVAPFLLERALRGHSRLAVLIEQSPWGRSNEAALRPLLERLPAGSVEVVWYQSGDEGLDATVDELVRAGRQAIVFVGNGIEAGLVVRTLARQDKPVPVFAHWALVGGDFWGANQARLEKVDLRFAQSVVEDDAPKNRNLASFLVSYRQRYGLGGRAPVPSLMGSAHAYDAVQLLARAVTRAGSPDRGAIRNALESGLSYSGVMREYRPAFTPERHDALDRSQLRLARFDARGRIVPAD